jgi:hypothetical protein
VKNWFVLGSVANGTRQARSDMSGTIFEQLKDST